jgi:hypothetical protein
MALTGASIVPGQRMPSATLMKVKRSSLRSQSIWTQSPPRTWRVPIKLQIGWTSSRSMARLSGRAPYLTSVPWLSNSSFAEACQLEVERSLRRCIENALLHHL